MLGAVEAGALDEMFSQGEPVLAGVDLDSGYLFGLSLSATRDAGAWAGLLGEGQAQGLSLSVAARGIAAGVREVFPHAEQRDDCFHVLYEEQGAVAPTIERTRYARMTSAPAQGQTRVVRGARRSIERYAFEAAMDTLRGALESTGALHRPEHVEALIEQVAGRVESLGVGECAKLAKYLRNRSGAGPEERAAPARGARAVVDAGGEPGVHLLVLGQGARQAGPGIVRGLVISLPPTPCKTGSAPRALRCSTPLRRCCTSAIAHRAPAPLSLRPQRRHPGLSRPVPCLVQSAHQRLSA